MLYAKVDGTTVLEYPLLEAQIRDRFPNTSFSSLFSPPDGYIGVERTSPPPTDHTQDVTEGDPAFIEGVLTTTWVVTDAPENVVTQRIADQALAVRSERNAKLAQSDWTQLADAATTGIDPAEWATYRQALRDVPEQAGFPFSVEWPTAPVVTA